MEAAELRETMIGYIKEADEQLLKVLKTVVENYKENDIVTYSLDGKPLTQRQYRQELIDAEAEIGRGDFTSQEDIEKEAENW